MASTRLIWTAVTLMAVVASTAFALGVPGLLWAGELAGLPRPLRAGVPVILDGGLAIFGLAAVVRRAQRRPARFAWCAMGALTVASAALQVAHILAVTPNGVGRTIGATVAATFPLLVLASTHVLLDLVVAPAPTGKRRRAAAAVTASATDTSLAAPRAARAPTKAVRTSAPRATTTPVAEIRALAEQGMSHRAIADQLGVGKGTVQRTLTTNSKTESQEAAA